MKKSLVLGFAFCAMSVAACSSGGYCDFIVDCACKGSDTSCTAQERDMYYEACEKSIDAVAGDKGERCRSDYLKYQDCIVDDMACDANGEVRITGTMLGCTSEAMAYATSCN